MGAPGKCTQQAIGTHECCPHVAVNRNTALYNCALPEVGKTAGRSCWDASADIYSSDESWQPQPCAAVSPKWTSWLLCERATEVHIKLLQLLSTSSPATVCCTERGCRAKQTSALHRKVCVAANGQVAAHYPAHPCTAILLRGCHHGSVRDTVAMQHSKVNEAITPQLLKVGIMAGLKMVATAHGNAMQPETSTNSTSTLLEVTPWLHLKG